MWNSVAPDGAKSVKANGPILLANTEYIEATMGSTANDTTNTDSIKDHFWHVDADLDGRHRYVNMPAYTIAGSEVDPVLGAAMGGAYYVKTKTATESPTHQDAQPFFRNATDIMQLLGIRACCTFSGRSTNGDCVMDYSYNMSKVTRFNPGSYIAFFDDELPSNNYLVHGGAVRTYDGNLPDKIMVLGLKGHNGALTETKSTTQMTILTTTLSRGTSSLMDSTQNWFFCFGG